MEALDGLFVSRQRARRVKQTIVRIAPAALDAVVWVGFATAEPNPGPDDFEATGTGFLVRHPVEDAGPENEAFCNYLVTAKHVVDDIGDNTFAVRLNNRDGFAQVRIPPKADQFHWYFDPDDPVASDVAVFPWGPSGGQFLYRVYPTTDFVTPDILKDQRVGIGDEVFAIGLFSPLEKQPQQIPIARVGHVAMMADENQPIRTSENEPPRALHLIEARSIGGLSGAPVYVRETTSIVHPDSTPGNIKYLFGAGDFYLLGLMHGHWDLPPDHASDPTEILHAGIAGVTPASKILKVLNQPALVERRSEIHEQVIANMKKAGFKRDSKTANPGEALQKSRKGLLIPIPTKEQFERDLMKATKREKK